MAVWQDPFVEIIKYGITHRAIGYLQLGDVEQVHDQILRKSVFRIRGSVAATNYLRVPREVPKGTQGLGLTGRYVYLQIRQIANSPCTIHLDFATTKKTALRVTLSSMFKNMRSTGTVLRVPLRTMAKWSVVVADMAALLKCHLFNQYSREEYSCLVAVTLCASLNVRNVLASSNLYTAETMPRSLQLSLEDYEWECLPSETAVVSPDKEMRAKASKLDAMRPSSSVNSRTSPRIDSPFGRSSKATRTTTATASTRDTKVIRDRNEVISKADQILRNAGIFGREAEKLSTNKSDHISPSRCVAQCSGAKLPQKSHATSLITQKEWPDPILDLERVIGFDSNATNTLLWLPDGSAFIYASYSTIILRYVDEARIDSIQEENGGSARDQHFLMGHTGVISAMALSNEGVLLASSETKTSPAPCSIRIWDLLVRECCIVVKAHAREVQSLCFSSETAQRQNLLLCGVGLDENSRTQILVWDCSDLRRSLAGNSASLESGSLSRRRMTVGLIARQTSDFPVQSIAFSPYGHEFPCLVSCGRENIRYWRVAKGGHIVGHPVILKEYSRGTLFNALGFDALCESFPSNMRRLRPVYAASSVGTLLVIDYDSREVVCVYQLHDASINCLVINEGFCVTGSDDGFLRVWPLDFTDFFLEAQHDAGVIAADVSGDGMKVLVGGRNSAIGFLDISSQLYKTILRSHAEPIVSSALLPWCASPIDQAIHAQKDEFMTASSDGTLRVWNARSGTQLYEFDVQQDQVTWIEPAPLDYGVVAVGFSSGCCRIFDIHRLSGDELSPSPSENTNIVVTEFQQHKSAIRHLRYTSDGLNFYTSGAGKQLCMYTVSQQRDFVPIKMLLVDFNSLDGRLSISDDDKYLAVISSDSQAVMLLQSDSLRVHCTITPPKPNSSAIGATELKLAEFSFNDQLLMLSKTDRLHVYSMKSQQFVRAIPLLGQEGGVTAVAMSFNLKYMATGGADGTLRVWQLDASGKVERMFQSFLGMTGAVSQLSFASRGKRLLATSNSTTSFVWRFLGNCSQSNLDKDIHLSALSDEGKENNGIGLANKITAAGGPKDALDDVDANSTAKLKNGNPEELSPSSDVPTPSAKPQFQLTLATDALVFDSVGTPTPSEISAPHTVGGPADADEIPTSVVQLLNENKAMLQLTQIIDGIDPFRVSWSVTHGKLLYAVGPTLWIESIGTLSNSISVRATDAVCDSSHDIVLLQLSPCERMVATVDSSYSSILVHYLEAETANQEHEQTNSSRISLQAHTVRVQSLAFGRHSTEMICFASSVNDTFRLSVASLISGQILWSTETMLTFDTILPLRGGMDRFFLFSRTVDKSSGACARMLNVMNPSPAESAKRVFQTTLVDRFPLNVTCATVSMDTQQEGNKCERYLAAVDEDSYCCFFDLETATFIATTQLLPASVRPRTGKTRKRLSSIDFIAWSDTDSKQSLLITGSIHDTFLHVHALPMQSTKFSSYSLIDWQRIGRSGVPLTRAIQITGGRLCSLSVDSNRGVGIVAAANGAITAIDFCTGIGRTHRRGYKQQSGGVFENQSNADVEDMVWAVNDTLLLSRSLSNSTITAWLPEIGCDVGHFDIGSTKSSTLCTCFTAHATQPLVLSSYDNGTLRLFNVCSGHVLANFSLGLDRRSVLSPEEHAEHARALRTLRQGSRGALVSPGLKMPPLITQRGNANTCSSVSKLEFVGESGTAIAATSDGRLFWMDFSKVCAAETTTPSTTRKARVSSPTPAEIVFQEITVSSSKGNRRSHRSVSVSINSIDVLLENAGNVECHAKFLIVLRLEFEGYSEYRVKVYADPSMRVLSEDKVLPSDEWKVAAPKVYAPEAIFLPGSHSTVLYSTVSNTDEDLSTTMDGWCLEIRDFRERQVLCRLVFDLNFPGVVTPLTPLQMVALSKAESSTDASDTVLLADARGGIFLLDIDHLTLSMVDTRISQSLQVSLLSSKAICRGQGKMVLGSFTSVRDNNPLTVCRRVVLGELKMGG